MQAPCLIWVEHTRKSLKGWEYSHIREHFIRYVISLYLKQSFCDSSNFENCRPLKGKCLPVLKQTSDTYGNHHLWRQQGWGAPQQLHLWRCSPRLLLTSGPLWGCTCSAHCFNQTLSTDSAKIKHGTQFFIRMGWLQTLAFQRKIKRTTKALLRFFPWLV